MFETRKRIWYVTAGLFAIICVIGLCARLFGWYDHYWFTDVILHTLAGGMFGLFWLGLTYGEYSNSRFIFLLTVAMAGVFGSYLWELWEFCGTYILPGIAIAYVPMLGDSLSDMACGMLGALIVGFMYWLKK